MRIFTTNKCKRIFQIILIWNIIICPFASMKVSAQWGFTIGQKEIPVAKSKNNPSDFKVYSGHPRLYFRDTDLPVINKRIKGEFKQEWNEMINDLNAFISKNPPARYAEITTIYNWETGRSIAFAALITGEEKYISYAKKWAETIIELGTEGRDPQYRGRLISLALIYDYLYSLLSYEDKRALQQGMLKLIERNWYFAAEADYVGTHCRGGNFVLAASLLTMITDLPELHDKLLKVRDNWINGYHPTQSWIAAEGGYHMGWYYSYSYISGNIYCVWSSATNECVYFPWQKLTPLFWIYGKHGDGSYSYTGDHFFPCDFNKSREMLMIASGIFKSPYGSWMTKQTSDCFADILYRDKSVRPLAPDDPKSPLPLSRNFHNAGVVVARDRWDEKTTLLQFRSSSFYSAVHHHRDENCFTLHYRGPLAIDAGFYDKYGSEHYRNYFVRTIAHNGIVVFDPKQKMIYDPFQKRTIDSIPASNDGGQTYRNEPFYFKDILPGGHAHLDGITHYYDTKEYTYVAGDATKAYDKDRVRLAQRDMVYLRVTSRPHPVIVIFDRVESTMPEFEKRFLLQTVNEPVINGQLAVTENKGGRLSCLTLYPEDARFQLIGGPGKEAWVNGVNYPHDRKLRQLPSDRELITWRLEVSPGEQRSQDYFLHVLFVDDADAKPVTPQEAELIKEKNNMGVSVAGWKIMFPIMPGGKARIEHKL